jgi:hypothetical protein
MSNRRLGGPPQRRDEHIQDAEFVEVEDWKAVPHPQAQPNTKLTLEHRWHATSFWWKLVIVFLPLLLVLRCVGSLVNVEDASSPEEEQLRTGEQLQANGSPMPTVDDLLAANDPQVCGHPDTIAFIRNRVLPTANSTAYGLSDEEFERAISLVHLDLTEITAMDIRSDVHEIACDGNLRNEGGGDANVTPISFRIRPSADPSGPPIYYLAASAVGSWPIYDKVEQVKAERPEPAAAEPKTVDDRWNTAETEPAAVNDAAINEDPSSIPPQ